MKLKLTRIEVKPFVVIVTVFNVILSFFLGLFMTIMNLLGLSQEPSMGPWAVVVFPIVNGALTCVTMLLLSNLYNALAKRVGGVVFEYEEVS